MNQAPLQKYISKNLDPDFEEQSFWNFKILFSMSMKTFIVKSGEGQVLTRCDGSSGIRIIQRFLPLSNVMNPHLKDPYQQSHKYRSVV